MSTSSYTIDSVCTNLIFSLILAQSLQLGVVIHLGFFRGCWGYFQGADNQTLETATGPFIWSGWLLFLMGLLNGCSPTLCMQVIFSFCASIFSHLSFCALPQSSCTLQSSCSPISSTWFFWSPVILCFNRQSTCALNSSHLCQSFSLWLVDLVFSLSSLQVSELCRVYCT